MDVSLTWLMLHGAQTYRIRVLLFRLFMSEGHLQAVYNTAKKEGVEEPNESQVNILRMASERIHTFAQQEQRPGVVSDIISLTDVHFMIALLAHLFRCIEKQTELSENRTQGLFVLLDLFGDLTSCVSDCPTIQNGIFEANLSLLCIGKISTSWIFSSNSPDMLRRLSDDKPGEGIKGLKVNLVRILGNISYKHFPTQEQIRTAGGIEILLSHSKIDPTNECMFMYMYPRNSNQA